MFKKIPILILAIAFFFSAGTVFAALSCSVAISCNSPNVVVLRMANTTNSHAELPNQNNYPQLVCCGGVSGLANSCANTFGVVLRLSGDTNAHVEENTQSTTTYNGHNACLSISSGTVNIGYQNNNCSGFDTTVVSMAKTPTNSHVGDSSAYIRKVCASVANTAIPPSLCSNISCGAGIIGNNYPPIPTEKQKEILRIADFNFDGRVDILDLSILLYYIDQGDNGFSMYDLNKDGRLDFLDVSILFYYWTVF